MCDWTAAEHEYVTGTDGYRGIAKKYGVSDKSVSTYGKDHDWVRKREEYRSETSAKLLRETANAIVDAQSRLASCVYEAAADLAEKLMYEIKGKDKLKSYEYKNYSGTLTDLAKLLSNAAYESDDDQTAGVVILPEREEVHE